MTLDSDITRACSPPGTISLTGCDYLTEWMSGLVIPQESMQYASDVEMIGSTPAEASAA